MGKSAQFMIIGAGIAGISLAARLAQHGASVMVLEQEDQPGYHATGRSAAMFVPTYGPSIIRALAGAGEAFFRQPPEIFGEVPILSKRGELAIFGHGDEHHHAQAEALGLQPISLQQAKALIPPLKCETLSAALYEERAEDIDVDILLQGFVRMLKKAQGQLHCNAAVQQLDYRHGRWLASTASGEFEAEIIVNAAGAWADKIAKLAGTKPLGIEPRRRSACLIEPLPDWNVSQWPMVFGPGESFYFKPMAGQVMLSPADATPVDPHDAWADDYKLAEAVERFEAVIDIQVKRLQHSWGGLRSFARDGDPVVGFDGDVEGFFWLAGQGGYGIQTAPALSEIAMLMLLGRDIPQQISAFGIDLGALNPQRFDPGNKITKDAL